MPVLLLAQGDARSRDLLKKAITARYGINPPALESLRIDFKGRARIKVGPLQTWVPVDVSAYFRFPTHMRWDFTVKPVGVPVQRGSESYDGERYYRARGNSTPTVIGDAVTVKSMRRRLWATAALLLTPLGEMSVRLTAGDDGVVDALNTQLNDSVRLSLRADGTLEQVEVACTNADSEREQVFRLHVTAAQHAVDELILPEKISAFWDSNPYFEIAPSKVTNNAAFSEGLFTLASDS